MIRILHVLLLAAVFLFGLKADARKTSGAETVNSGTPGNAGTGRTRQNSASVRESGSRVTVFVDGNGEKAYIPAHFKVSARADERTIRTGLVVIGPDGSEFVWVPTARGALKTRDFGRYFSGGSFAVCRDDTGSSAYRAMSESVAVYGGFYMGRYEASFGGGGSLADYVPASKPVTDRRPGRIWVRFSPQNAAAVCGNLYRDNPTVRGFLPWGANWDATLLWLISSGGKSFQEVAGDSTSWGNYSNDAFSRNARANFTGAFEKAKANNIYDLAGNNWEWTQERGGGSKYVMRGGGSSLMGGACPGDRFPVAIRDPLPGNSRHPNVCFRVALYLVVHGKTGSSANEAELMKEAKIK